MREIKFRVWDKVNKEFLDYQFKRIEDLEMWVYCSKDSMAHSSLQHCIDHTDFIVMQYTGLKDKNGKEIYEGDKIRFDCYYNSTKGAEDEVEYATDGFFLFDIGLRLGILENIEVIGNIYEKL